MDSLIEFLEVPESTVITQKILSAVWRLNKLQQSAKPSFVVMNLKGQHNQETKALGHSATSTYGALHNYAVGDIEFWLLQLVKELNLLKVSTDRTYLELSEQGRQFLKNNQSIQLRACLFDAHILTPSKAAMPVLKPVRKSVPPANSQNAKRTSSDKSENLYRSRDFRRFANVQLPTLKVNSKPISRVKKEETEVERQLREGTLKEANLSKEIIHSAGLPKDTRPRYTNRRG